MHMHRFLVVLTLAGFFLKASGSLGKTEKYTGPLDFSLPLENDPFTGPGQTIFIDGEGLPPGEGTWLAGKMVYEDQCISCHGAILEGKIAFNAPALIGGRGSLTSGKPFKTVESYWPSSVTLFDYIYRAMPFLAPKTLSPGEVYALCAYILAEAGVTDKNLVLTEKKLPEIKMPNRTGFILPVGSEHLADYLLPKS